MSKYAPATPDLAPGFREKFARQQTDVRRRTGRQCVLIAQVPSEVPMGQILEILSGFPDETFELC